MVLLNCYFPERSSGDGILKKNMGGKFKGLSCYSLFEAPSDKLHDLTDNKRDRASIKSELTLWASVYLQSYIRERYINGAVCSKTSLYKYSFSRLIKSGKNDHK